MRSCSNPPKCPPATARRPRPKIARPSANPHIWEKLFPNAFTHFPTGEASASRPVAGFIHDGEKRGRRPGGHHRRPRYHALGATAAVAPRSVGAEAELLPRYKL